MAKRAAGFLIYRCKPDSGAREWLLMQTSYGEHHWTPPKGHLDQGEDDITAAYRETLEEAGLDRDTITVHTDISAQLSYQAFNAPKIVTYWLAKLNNYSEKVTLSSEHQDYKWLSLADAMDLSGFQDMAKVFKDFDDKLNQQS